MAPRQISAAKRRASGSDRPAVTEAAGAGERGTTITYSQPQMEGYAAQPPGGNESDSQTTVLRYRNFC